MKTLSFSTMFMASFLLLGSSSSYAGDDSVWGQRVSPFNENVTGLGTGNIADIRFTSLDQDGVPYDLGDALDDAKEKGNTFVFQLCTPDCSYCALTSAHYTGSSVYNMNEFFVTVLGAPPAPFPIPNIPFLAIQDTLEFNQVKWIDLMVQRNLYSDDPSIQSDALAWHQLLGNNDQTVLHSDGVVDDNLINLKRDFYISGFPSFVVIDKDGRILGLPGGSDGDEIIDEFFNIVMGNEPGPAWTDPLYYFIYKYVHTVQTRNPQDIDLILAARLERLIIEINTVNESGTNGVYGRADSAYMIGKLDDVLSILCDKNNYVDKILPTSCTGSIAEVLGGDIVDDVDKYYSGIELNIVGEKLGLMKQALLAHDDASRRQHSLCRNEIPDRVSPVIYSCKGSLDAVRELLGKDSNRKLEILSGFKKQD